METKKTQNGYKYVPWGEGTEFPTYADGWKYAHDVIIPQLKDDKSVVGNPVIMEGKKAGNLIVRYQYTQ